MWAVNRFMSGIRTDMSMTSTEELATVVDTETDVFDRITAPFSERF